MSDCSPLRSGVKQSIRSELDVLSSKSVGLLSLETKATVADIMRLNRMIVDAQGEAF